MEIPKELRMQIMGPSGLLDEDFYAIMDDKAKKTKKQSDDDEDPAGGPKTKFKALALKAVELVKSDPSALGAFKSAKDNRGRMSAVLGAAEAVTAEELKSVFSRRLSRAHKNHAIVREEGNFYLKKDDFKHALNLFSTALKLALVPPPALHEWKVVTETPYGIVTETVVTGGADDGGSTSTAAAGNAGGGDGGNADGGENSRDVEAAICLGCRSSVHLQRRDYDECIKDIDAALWFGCPQALSKRLEDRREVCVEKMSKKWAGLAKAAAQPKGGAERKGVSFMALADFEDSWKERLISQYMVFCDPQEKGKEKKEEDIKKGRYTKASCDVPAGEILMVERPLAFCLAFGSSADNCHYCCRPLDFKTFLPSPLEEGVLLCSVECLEYAMDGFHAWESKVNLCRLFEIYDEEDKDREFKARFDEISGSSILSLRSILAHELKEWVELEQALDGLIKKWFTEEDDKPKDAKQPSRRVDLSRLMNMNLSLLPDISPNVSLLPSGSTKPVKKKEEDETFDTADKKMKLFFTLEGHREDRDWQGSLFLCCRALLLVKFLEEIGYLDDDKSTEAKVSIGRLLITMMESLEYNIHPIVQVGMTSGQVEDIGSALYPVAARYLNHSCDPNTLRVSLGSSVVFVARRNIKAGEEITDGYGPHFHKSEKVARKEKLKTFFNFDCECQACSEDFPLLRGLNGHLSPNQTRQLEEARKQMKESLASKRSRKEDQVQARLKQFFEHLKDFDLSYPHRSHGVGSALVGMAFWQLLGNKKKEG